MASPPPVARAAALAPLLLLLLASAGTAVNAAQFFKASPAKGGSPVGAIADSVLNTHTIETSNAAPPVHNSKASEWGCCRLCLARDVPAEYKAEFKPHDPAQRVNCCPLCPWPKQETRMLGPFLHYFDKRPADASGKKEPRDDYEADLDALAKERGAGPGAAAPGGPVKESFFELAASVMGRVWHGARETPLEKLDDPYAEMRGKNLMNRWENYVYILPPKVDTTNMVAPKNDLPPCCNICTRHSNKRMDRDPTCCMQCAVHLPQSKRERFPHRAGLNQHRPHNK
jgi:hypothetical protein